MSTTGSQFAYVKTSLFRRNQPVHIIVHKERNSSWEEWSETQRRKSRIDDLGASLITVATKEWDHMDTSFLQSQRAWRIDSGAELHLSQMGDGTQLRLNITYFVANDPLQALQRKWQSFGGAEIFHKRTRCWLNTSSWIAATLIFVPNKPSQYPLYIEYSPFFVGHQKSLSFGQEVSKGIDKIAAIVSSSNHCDNTLMSQSPVLKFIRLAIHSWYGSSGSRHL